jgi:integrase
VYRKSSKRGGRVVRYKLADGTIREKHYPPYKPRQKRQGETVGDLLASWQRSPEWARLAPNTKAQYTTYSRPLLGLEHLPVKQLTRRHLLEHRDAVAASRGNGAGIAFSRAASAALSWALDRGWIEHTPAQRLRKGLPSGHLPAWTDQEAETAMRRLPEHLRRAIVLALYTGQRRGDLIAMPWSAYDGRAIRLTQEKTGQALVVPAPAELRAELDEWRRETSSTLILVNKFGRPWQGSNLSKQLGAALAEIEGFPAGRNIHGLRKLAARNLAQAGCTLHEIAAITGHQSLSMLQLYTKSVDQEQAAEAAIIKLASRRKS